MQFENLRKSLCFYFYCLMQVVYENYFRAKHLFPISDSLVFQYLRTSPEALLNLGIISVIIYSLHCHNTLGGQAGQCVRKAHRKPSQTSQHCMQCDYFKIPQYLCILLCCICCTPKILWKREKIYSGDRVQAFE